MILLSNLKIILYIFLIYIYIFFYTMMMIIENIFSGDYHLTLNYTEI